MEDSTKKSIGKSQETLRKLRKALDDVLTSDHTDAVLMKWLRTANFNLRKCEFLFREALACRALYQLDTIAVIFNKPEAFSKYEIVSSLGIAKDGTPICYVAMGRGDYWGYVSSVSSYECCWYCSHWIEYDLRRAREQSKKTGREVNEVTYIIDMEGFMLHTVTRTSIIEMALDLFRMLQDIYPEIWKHLLIVNAAFYFYQAFNIIKPIFRSTILQHIQVVSKEETPDLLLRYIDEEELPAFLGGKRVDSNGDPMCREFLKFGGEVSTDYYLSQKPGLSLSLPGVQSVFIRARSFYNHPLVVHQPNSRLHIEIRTEGGSIATSVLYKEFGPDPGCPDFPPMDKYLDEHNENSNVRNISPCVKLQTHICPVDVHCLLPWPGIYIFKFDNSYNWMVPRRLFFRFEIIPPQS